MNKKSVRKAISPKGGGAIPVPGPGRPKGSPNKLSRTAKENIEAVFEGLGDYKAMQAWVELSPRNKTIFYSEIYPKLLAVNVSHSGLVSGFFTIGYETPTPPDNGSVK